MTILAEVCIHNANVRIHKYPNVVYFGKNHNKSITNIFAVADNTSAQKIAKSLCIYCVCTPSIIYQFI